MDGSQGEESSQAGDQDCAPDMEWHILLVCTIYC